MLSILQNPLVLVPLVVWTLFWKGLALWKSARNGQKVWFVAILILNTLGILEIIYLFIFGKNRPELPDGGMLPQEPTKKII